MLSRLPTIVHSPFSLYIGKHNDVYLGPAKLALVGAGTKQYFDQLYSWYQGTERAVAYYQHETMAQAISKLAITAKPNPKPKAAEAAAGDDRDSNDDDHYELKWQRAQHTTKLLQAVMEQVKTNNVVYSDDERAQIVNNFHIYGFVTVAVRDSEAAKHSIINVGEWNASDNKHARETAVHISGILAPNFDSKISNYTEDLEKQRNDINFSSKFWNINSDRVVSLDYINCSQDDYDRLYKMVWAQRLAQRDFPRTCTLVEQMQMGVRIRMRKWRVWCLSQTRSVTTISRVTKMIL